MKKFVLSFLLKVLFAVAAAVLIVPFSQAEVYCKPNNLATPRQSEKDAKELLKASQKIRFDFDENNSRTQIKTDLTRLQTQIQNFIKTTAYPDDKLLALPAILSYFSIARDFIAEGLQQQPGQLTSLAAYRELFGFTLEPSDVMAILPTRLLIHPDLDLYPVADGAVRGSQLLTFNEITILRAVIHGIGFSNRNVTTNYFETSKCLLATTEISKMAFNQILRGQTKIDFAEVGEQKACGNLTLQEIGDAYLRFHSLQHLAVHRRTALFKSLPTLENYIPESVIEVFKTQKLDTASKYISIYLDQKVPDAEKVEPRLATYVKDEMNKALGQLEHEFPIDSVALLTSNAQVKSLIEGLLTDCHLKLEVKNKPQFFKSLLAAERVYFYGQFSQAINNIANNIVEMPEALLDRTILQIIYTSRVQAAAEALHDTLSLGEKPSELADIATAVDDFTEQTLAPLARRQIIDRPEDHRTLINYIKERYRAEQRVLTPLASLRDSYESNLIKQSKTLANYDNPAFGPDQLPFSASAILEIYKLKTKTLSPKADELAQIIFGENDFETAQILWKRTNTFFRENMSELKIGTKVFARETAIDKPLNWLTSHLFSTNSAREQTQTGKVTKADFETLKYLAERVGLVAHEKPPEKLQDVLLEMTQDFNNGQLKDAIKLYRELLKIQIFDTFRILEMPYREGQVYQALAGQSPRAQSAPLVDSALVKVQKNIATHLKQIVNATGTDGLHDYIVRSQVLNVLLGETDLDSVILKKDFWPDMQNLAEFKGDEETIFPHLLQEHYDIKSRMLRTEDINRELWDEFYGAIGTAALPLMAAWGMKGFMPWIPNAFGGTAASAPLELGANSTLFVIDGYWAAFLGFIGIDIGVQVSRRYEASNDIRNIESMAYTEAYKLEVPLISERVLHSQLQFFTDRKDSATSRAAWNAVFFALPFVSYKFVQHYYQVIRPARYAKKQAFVDALMAEGKVSEALNIESKYAASYTNKFARRVKPNYFYFKRLKVAPGTWRPSELEEALAKIKNSGTATAKEIAQAQEAYKILMQELGSQYVGIQNTPVMRDAFVKALWGNGEEAERFVAAYNRLFNTGNL